MYELFVTEKKVKTKSEKKNWPVFQLNLILTKVIFFSHLFFKLHLNYIFPLCLSLKPNVLSKIKVLQSHEQHFPELFFAQMCVSALLPCYV